MDGLLSPFSSLSSPPLRGFGVKIPTTQANHFSTVQRQLAAGSSCFRLISSLSRWVSLTLRNGTTSHTTVFPCLAPVRPGIIPRTILSMPCSSARQMIAPKSTRELAPPVSQFRMDTSKKKIIFTFLGHTQNGRLVFQLLGSLQIKAQCLWHGSTP